MLWWMLLCTEHWMWHRPRDWWQGWSKLESSRECAPLGTVQQMDQILAQQQLADYKWNMKHRWWWLFCSCLILVFFFVWIFQSLVCPGCHCLWAHTWRCRLQIFFFQALTMNWWTLAAETQKTRKLEKKIVNHKILIFFLTFFKEWCFHHLTHSSLSVCQTVSTLQRRWWVTQHLVPWLSVLPEDHDITEDDDDVGETRTKWWDEHFVWSRKDCTGSWGQDT